MTMNAGAIPKNHWTQDQDVGGGRSWEACHYIDLMRYLLVIKLCLFPPTCVRSNSGIEITEDVASITSFEDGSLGTIHYLANGGKSFPKERIEVFVDQGVLQLDNFRKLIGYNWEGFNQKKRDLSKIKGN